MRLSSCHLCVLCSVCTCLPLENFVVGAIVHVSYPAHSGNNPPTGLREREVHAKTLSFCSQHFPTSTGSAFLCECVFTATAGTKHLHACATIEFQMFWVAVFRKAANGKEDIKLLNSGWQIQALVHTHIHKRSHRSATRLYIDTHIHKRSPRSATRLVHWQRKSIIKKGCIHYRLDEAKQENKSKWLGNPPQSTHVRKTRLFCLIKDCQIDLCCSLKGRARLVFPSLFLCFLVGETQLNLLGLKRLYQFVAHLVISVFFWFVNTQLHRLGPKAWSQTVAGLPHAWLSSWWVKTVYNVCGLACIPGLTWEGDGRLVRLQWFCPSFFLTHRT